MTWGQTGPHPGRLAALCAIVFCLLALESGGFGRLTMFGVRPEMLVVFTCCIALQRGPWQGLALGLVLGLLTDLPGGHLVGLSAVGYGAAGFLAGVLGGQVFPERWVVVLAAVGLGTIVSQVIYMLGALAFGFRLPLLEIGARMIPPLVLFHVLLTPVVYPLGRWMGETLLPGGFDA